MYMSGMSMNAAAKILGVSAQSVRSHRDFGEVNYSKPALLIGSGGGIRSAMAFSSRKKTSYGFGLHMTV